MKQFIALIVMLISSSIFLGAESNNYKLAIVIDDVTCIKEVDSFVKLKKPITFAVMPHFYTSKEVNEHLKNMGYDTLLHLPLEGSNTTLNEKTKGIIVTEMKEEDIKEELERATNSVGATVGVNNHMGSVYTKNKHKMSMLLDLLNDKKLAYIDSHTSGFSIAYELALMKGVRTNRNRWFLDNTKTVEYTLKQIHIAMQILKNRPDNSMVIIGHCFPSTAKAIEIFLNEDKDINVELVSITEILK